MSEMKCGLVFLTACLLSALHLWPLLSDSAILQVKFVGELPGSSNICPVSGGWQPRLCFVYLDSSPVPQASQTQMAPYRHCPCLVTACCWRCRSQLRAGAGIEIGEEVQVSLQCLFCTCKIKSTRCPVWVLLLLVACKVHWHGYSRIHRLTKLYRPLVL